MDTVSINELKRLDNTNNTASNERYRAICERRDTILTHAVIQSAHFLLNQSGFMRDLAIEPEQSKQNAILAVQDYLSTRSSIPEMDQYLLALVGVGALYGKAIEPLSGDVTDQTGVPADGLDLTLVHRLARAMDRCNEHEFVLWRYINAQDEFDGRDGALVRVAIRLLLDDTTLSELDTAFEKMVLDSIHGG